MNLATRRLEILSKKSLERIFQYSHHWKIDDSSYSTTGDVQKLLFVTRSTQNLTDAFLSNQIIISTESLTENIELSRLQQKFGYKKFVRNDLGLPITLNVLRFQKILYI